MPSQISNRALARRLRPFRIRKFALVITLAGIPACGNVAGEPAETPGIRNAERGGSVKIDERLFDQVPLNSRERTACSPASPGPRWRGVLIQAPSRAVYPSGGGKKPGAIPICGLYTLDIAAIAASQPLTLVAVDVQRGETFKGAVVDNDPSPEAPPPDSKPLNPSEYQGIATSSYFNPDLTRYVSLPPRPAVYEVFAEYGGAVSNRVTIQVVVP